MLLHPPADSWPGYHGDYSGRRHSALTQITPQNVKNLGLAWAFQTEQTRADQVFAAAGGWHFVLHGSGQHLGRRCALRPSDLALHLSAEPRASTSAIAAWRMYKGYLFFVTPDAHLVSLNAKDGTVRWNVEVADVTKGYWTSMAPLVVGNHVLVGVSGDFDNLSGFIRVDRSGDGRNAVAMEFHSAGGNSESNHRRHDVDDGNVRSRSQSRLLGNRESRLRC